jgi:uncharacterized protein (DUF2252 family)
MNKRKKKIAALAGPRAEVRRHKVRISKRPAPREAGRAPAYVESRRSASTAEQIAAGKALRDKVLRASHSHWKRSSGVDPIKILQASDAGREPKLVPIRYGRMLQSPFAFYRGSAGIMAADLAETPTTGIFVQACGDCHLLNFGGFATPERNIIFDINDFDETLPAPWEWDLKRLAASFVLAARSTGLTDAKARDIAIKCARSYRKHLAEFNEMDPLSGWYAKITADDFLAGLPKAVEKRGRARIDKAMKRTGDIEFPKLTEMVNGRISIRDTPPLIYHPPETRTPEFHALLSGMFASYRETLPDDTKRLVDQYELVDAAIKVVGVGSVGRICSVALLMSASNDPLFLQFKEAVQSVLEPFAGKSKYAHHGQRVVIGQRLMQPASDLFLGWVTGRSGRQFYVRQLRDAKISPLVEAMDAETLDVYAGRCGWALARAHSKAADTSMIGGYLGNSDEFDEAIGTFSMKYADRAESDHAALKAAVRKGKVAVYQES